MLRWRLAIAVAIFLPVLLSGCAQTWERNPPAAAAGGMGIMADGEIAEGPDAVSSVSELPSHTRRGIQPPYGTQGAAAAYEFGPGYRIGAGDRLTVRVAGEIELTNDYVVDGAGDISMP